MSSYAHGITVAWGEKVYLLTEDVWQDEEYLVTDEGLKDLVGDLVKKGVVLASIPATGDPIGCACYLINLNVIASDTGN